MSGPIDEIERAILDHVFSDPIYTPPATWFLCLSTTTPVDDGTNFTEPATGGYARLPTTAGDWAAATGSAPASKANSSPLIFPPSSGSQGTFTYFGLALASIPGVADIKFFGVLGSSIAVLVVNKAASFAIGALVLKTGEPGDSY